MTPITKTTSHPDQISLSKRMIIGAGIGLFLISLFVLPFNNPDPAWGKYWMIRPFILVPFAGAMGGLCNYYIIKFHKQLGINKAMALIVSLLVLVIGLWLGVVLGLDGTLWD